MAKNYNGSPGGSDAATIKPKLIPDYELLPRDDSGGPEYNGYTMEFGDGGFVQGPKAHLSCRGGSDDPEEEDEISESVRAKGAMKGGRLPDNQTSSPGKSRKMSKE